MATGRFTMYNRYMELEIRFIEFNESVQERLENDGWQMVNNGYINEEGEDCIIFSKAI